MPITGKYLLEHGDIICIGERKFRFEYPETYTPGGASTPTFHSKLDAENINPQDSTAFETPLKDKAHQLGLSDAKSPRGAKSASKAPDASPKSALRSRSSPRSQSSPKRPASAKKPAKGAQGSLLKKILERNAEKASFPTMSGPSDTLDVVDTTQQPVPSVATEATVESVFENAPCNEKELAPTLVSPVEVQSPVTVSNALEPAPIEARAVDTVNSAISDQERPHSSRPTPRASYMQSTQASAIKRVSKSANSTPTSSRRPVAPLGSIKGSAKRPGSLQSKLEEVKIAKTISDSDVATARRVGSPRAASSPKPSLDTIKPVSQLSTEMFWRELDNFVKTANPAPKPLKFEVVPDEPSEPTELDEFGSLAFDAALESSLSNKFKYRKRTKSAPHPTPVKNRTLPLISATSPAGPQSPASKRVVSFGPPVRLLMQLSPEIFDKNLPTASPISRGRPASAKLELRNDGSPARSVLKMSARKAGARIHPLADGSSPLSKVASVTLRKEQSLDAELENSAEQQENDAGLPLPFTAPTSGYPEDIHDEELDEMFAITAPEETKEQSVEHVEQAVGEEINVENVTQVLVGQVEQVDPETQNAVEKSDNDASVIFEQGTTQLSDIKSNDLKIPEVQEPTGAELNSPEQKASDETAKPPQTPQAEPVDDDSDRLVVKPSRRRSVRSKDSPYAGVSKLLKTPKQGPEMFLSGIRETFATPKASTAPHLEGIKNMMKTPVVPESPSLVGVKHIFKTPLASHGIDQSKYDGLVELMKTPSHLPQPGVVVVGPDSLDKKRIRVASQELPADTEENLPADNSADLPGYDGLADLMKTPAHLPTPGVVVTQPLPLEKKKHRIRSKSSHPEDSDENIPSTHVQSSPGYDGLADMMKTPAHLPQKGVVMDASSMDVQKEKHGAATPLRESNTAVEDAQYEGIQAMLKTPAKRMVPRKSIKPAEYSVPRRMRSRSTEPNTPKTPLPKVLEQEKEVKTVEKEQSAQEEQIVPSESGVVEEIVNQNQSIAEKEKEVVVETVAEPDFDAGLDKVKKTRGRPPRKSVANKAMKVTEPQQEPAEEAMSKGDNGPADEQVAENVVVEEVKRSRRGRKAAEPEKVATEMEMASDEVIPSSQTLENTAESLKDSQETAEPEQSDTVALKPSSRGRRGRKAKLQVGVDEHIQAAADTPAHPLSATEPVDKPQRKSRGRKAKEQETAAEAVAEPVVELSAEEAVPEKKTRPGRSRNVNLSTEEEIKPAEKPLTGRRTRKSAAKSEAHIEEEQVQEEAPVEARAEPESKRGGRSSTKKVEEAVNEDKVLEEKGDVPADAVAKKRGRVRKQPVQVHADSLEEQVEQESGSQSKSTRLRGKRAPADAEQVEEPSSKPKRSTKKGAELSEKPKEQEKPDKRKKRRVA